MMIPMEYYGFWYGSVAVRLRNSKAKSTIRRLSPILGFKTYDKRWDIQYFWYWIENGCWQYSSSISFFWQYYQEIKRLVASVFIHHDNYTSFQNRQYWETHNKKGMNHIMQVLHCGPKCVGEVYHQTVHNYEGSPILCFKTSQYLRLSRTQFVVSSVYSDISKSI